MPLHNGTEAPADGPLPPRRLSISITAHSIWLGAAVVVGILLAALIVSKALSTLVLLLLAIILGEAIRPLVVRMQRRRIPGPVAVVLIYVTVLVVLGALLWLLLSPLVQEGIAFSSKLPDYIVKLRHWVADLQRQLHAQAGLSSVIDSLSRGLTAALQHLVPALVAVPFGVLSSILSLFISLVVVLTMTLFWLMGSQRLQPFVVGLFPPDERGHVASVISEVGRSFGGYLRGTLMTMILIALLAWLGLLILGVPYELLLGVVAGLTELLPYIGPWISGSIAVLVALVAVDPLKAVQVIILFLLIYEIEANIIQPLVMSKQVHMDPLLVIVSVLIGINMLGVLGAILAVPLAAGAQVLIVRVVAPSIRRKYATADVVPLAVDAGPQPAAHDAPSHPAAGV